MPAAVPTQTRPKISEEMFQALKTYICKERQRRKQEQEADEEEEKQRKEREQKQKQDVMTLVETRQQIAELESKVEKLKDKKHVLFLELKKILTEEDNKKKQMKEPRYILHEPSAPIYLPVPNRNLPYKVSALSSAHSLMTSSPVNKRPHTPSPPPTTSYHPNYGYKQPPLPPYNPPIHLKSDEAARRHEDSRAVLWNKNNHYPSTTYYPSSVVQSAFSYASPKTQPDSRKPVYLPGSRSQVSSSNHQGYLTNLHPSEHKESYPEEKYYGRPSSHVQVHPGSINIPQPNQTGGMSSGYPVRPTQQPPMNSGYPGSPAQVPYLNVPNVPPGSLPPPF